jgi:diguanylate cyclase (GGDEF)-like protein
MARILIVDDEPQLRFILQTQLEHEGYEVVAAEDGFKALSLMHPEPPDLVLLDMTMPGLPGIEVLRRMKGNYRTALVPVIFLTARADRETALEGLDAGAVDHVVKPYDPAELLARVRRLLTLVQVQRQASPLTGLPGNRAVEHEITRRIAKREAYALLHVDIDHFKSYNDYYGYQRGDQVICRTSALLCDALDTVCGGQGFVGHVGGDDFVVVAGHACGTALANEIVARFDAMIPDLYDEPDRERGDIGIASRQGQIERFPLLTVTVAVAWDDGGRFEHVGAIGAVVSELKRHGKSQRGSVVVPDRRSAPNSASLAS